MSLKLVLGGLMATLMCVTQIRGDAMFFYYRVKASADTLLWNGDARLGQHVFKVLETDSIGIISVVTDPEEGKVWKLYKPIKNHRTEVHAARDFTAVEGDDIYIGWRSKLDIPENAPTFAIFQWKAYGNDMYQNFPVVLKTLATGEIQLQYATPQKVHIGIWATPLKRNVWNNYVLHLKISRKAAIGFIEFWYNGVQQQLAGNSFRYYGCTLDADRCDPKWGVYGGDAYTITNYVTKLKIGSTYADVAPQ
ncbi:heparin lyase I family protein [Mucilaginibacter sp. AW1-3]